MNHSALPGFLSADSGEFRKAVTDEQTVLFWIFPQVIVVNKIGGEKIVWKEENF